MRYQDIIVAQHNGSIILTKEPLSSDLEPVFMTLHNSLAYFTEAILKIIKVNYMWICPGKYLEDEDAYSLQTRNCNIYNLVMIQGKYIRSSEKFNDTWLFLGRSIEKNTALFYRYDCEVPNYLLDYFLVWSIDSKWLYDVSRSLYQLQIPIFSDQFMNSSLISISNIETSLFVHPILGIVTKNYSGNIPGQEIIFKENKLYDLIHCKLSLRGDIKENIAIFSLLCNPNLSGMYFFPIGTDSKGLGTAYSNNPYELVANINNEHQVGLRRIQWDWNDFDPLPFNSKLAYSINNGFIKMPFLRWIVDDIFDIELIDEKLYIPKKKMYLYFQDINGRIFFELTKDENISTCSEMNSSMICVSSNKRYKIMSLRKSPIFLGFKPILDNETTIHEPSKNVKQDMMIECKNVANIYKESEWIDILEYEQYEDEDPSTIATDKNDNQEDECNMSIMPESQNNHKNKEYPRSNGSISCPLFIHIILSIIDIILFFI